MRPIIASLKLCLFCILCAAVVPPQALLLVFYRGRYAYIIPQIFHIFTCVIFGIRVRIEGEPAEKGKTLFVCNHLSYLDISVIGSILRASFVAKQEVLSWPGFGFLSKLQQSQFISRERSTAQKAQNTLQNALKENKSLILFPEGTSTDGADVYPFKSSMFSIAYTDPDLLVQPIALSVKLANGHGPKTQEERDLYAWHVNMETDLGEHLWRFLKSSGVTITLHFFPPKDPKTFEHRKELSHACYMDISSHVRYVSHLNK